MYFAKLNQLANKTAQLEEIMAAIAEFELMCIGAVSGYRAAGQVSAKQRPGSRGLPIWKRRRRQKGRLRAALLSVNEPI